MPLLAIDFTWRGERRVLYAKQESLNLTGSNAVVTTVFSDSNKKYLSRTTSRPRRSSSVT